MSVKLSIQGGLQDSNFGSLKERLNRAAHYRIPNSVYMAAAADIMPIMVAALSEEAPFNKQRRPKWQGLPEYEREKGSLKKGFFGQVLIGGDVGQISFYNRTSYANFVENGHYTRMSREVDINGRRPNKRTRNTYASQWRIPYNDYVGRALDRAMPSMLAALTEAAARSNAEMMGL